MKIKLMYFLNKKNIKLKYFCNINNLNSYDELKLYCHEHSFIPVDELFYFDQIPLKVKEKKKIEKKRPGESKEKQTNKVRRPRKTSKK